MMPPLNSDALACTSLQEVVATTMAELPKWVDAVTRIDALVLTCRSKTYHVDKFINQPISEMRDDWQGRKETQWDESICRGNMGPLVEAGWRILQVLTFASGERIEIAADCAGLKSRTLPR
jgi:hypothetical protein